MRLLWDNLLDENSSWSAYSEDGNYPVSNLYDTRLSRVYHSNGIDLVAFSSIGTAFNNNCESPALCSLTSSLVAFFTDSSDTLATYEWSGTTWSTIGTGVIISTADMPALCAMTSSLVGFIDFGNKQLGAYGWNGSSWAVVGSLLAISSLGYPAICALTTAQVALIDDTLDILRTYTFNGSTWATVGTASTVVCSLPALCAMTSSQIIVLDRTNHALQAWEWNGSTWITVGNTLTVSTMSWPSMCSITSTLLAVVDDNQNLRAYDWDGTNFIQVGIETTVQAASFTALCSPTSSQVAYIGSASDNLAMYEINPDINYLQIKETGTPKYLSIVNHNLSSDTEIYLQGASSSLFTTPTFTESITWSSYTIVSTIASTVSCDFFKVQFNLHSTTTGYVSIGYLYLGDYLEAPPMKIDQVIKDETMAKVTISDGGQAYGDDNYSYVAPTINFPYLTSTQRTDMREMWASVKNIHPVILIIWPENTDVEKPHYCIFDQKSLEWKRTDDINYPWATSLVLREIF